jgi:hypothetical protein
MHLLRTSVVLFASLFVAITAVMCLAVVLAILAMTYVYYLSGSRAIADDGMVRGAVAPTWSLAASSGKVVSSPPDKHPLQLIVFGDHSLKSFPSVVEGLCHLLAAARQLEIVILMRRPNDLTVPLLQLLGLGEIPVVTGSSSLYGRYNVRVMPFVIFVDSDGRVRGSSLVNHAWQLEKLWELSNVAPRAEEDPPVSRRRRLIGTRL